MLWEKSENLTYGDAHVRTDAQIKFLYYPEFIGNVPLVACIPILIVFLAMLYKVGMIYTLAYLYFKICSDWTKFHEELNFLKHVFLKNGYPLSFISKCFKMVINKLVIKHPQVTTFEMNTLILNKNISSAKLFLFDNN